MYGNVSSQGRYLCKPDIGGCGKVGMKMQWVDDAIRREVLRKSQNTEAMPDDRNYQIEIDAIDANMDALRQAHTDGALDLADMLPLLRAQRDKRALLVKDAATSMLKDNLGIRAFADLTDWQDASVSARRVWIQRFIKAVTVLPTTKIGRVRYDPERLSILWNDGTESMPSKIMKEYPVITDANRASLSLLPSI